jgi:predicted CXXCH cytochrome family protein
LRITSARSSRFYLYALALLVCRPFASASAGSAACAACHRAIYESYKATPMAASSGTAGSGLIQEKFDHAAFDNAPTGFRYRIYRNRGAYFVEFMKPDGTLRGVKALPYFVGSGSAARSYLLADDGYLFEAPVAYYSGTAKWDLAPNYETYAYPYLTRPAAPTCLTCHASFLKAVPQTQNRYSAPPFGEGGIACERCHGPGESHIQKMTSGSREGGTAILNPAKLDAERRDSICSQCHLTGEVRVMRAGRDWQSFQAGDRLYDSLTVFVRSGTSPGMKVTSHVEKLAQSACKRASGDRLWCGTCHDPHVVPKPAERATWFRQKCLGCHDSGACRETIAARARRQDDCTACHMTKSPVVDAQHVVYTDHSIPRWPRISEAAPRPDAGLVVFGGGRAEPRDVALAYAIAASRTRDAAFQSRALTLLQETEHNSPDDVEVLLYLAELYRNGNPEDQAVPLYQRAIRLDPTQVTASVGLGGIMMERGQYTEAIRLWQDALSKNGGLELVRINMAMAQWRSGDLRSAESSLVKAIELNPGFAAPVELLQQLRQQLQQAR